MTRENPVQFAVVREDPMTELALIDRFNARAVLLVASGGCTALSVLAERPEVELTVFDLNPAQLELTRRKWDALNSGAHRARFNVESADPEGLNACGNFERLFTGLRRFIEDFILDNETDLDRYLGECWEPMDSLASSLHAGDRSLFYQRLRVCRRTSLQ